MFDKISPQALFPSTIWIHDVKPGVAGRLNARLIDELDRLDVQYRPFEITGCQANGNPKEGIHPAHNHPNNYLSGVYYLQIPDGANALQLHDPRPQGMMIWPRVKNYNQHTRSSPTCACAPGSRSCSRPGWSTRSTPTRTRRRASASASTSC